MKHLLSLFFCLTIISFSFSQTKSGNDSLDIINRINILENNNISLNITFESINEKINKNTIDDSILKSLILEHKLLDSLINTTIKRIDGDELQKEIDTAQSIINAQDSFIQIFEVVYGMIAVLALFAYFFNIRPLVKDVKKSLKKVEDARIDLEDEIRGFDDIVNEKLKENFEVYEKKQKTILLDELFLDIESNFPNQKQLAIEKLATLNPNVFESNRIDRLFNVIDSNLLFEREKSIIVEVLIEIDSPQIRRYLQSWSNVSTEENELKETLYNYYIKTGFNSYLPVISKFIHDHISPLIEFMNLLSKLPAHPKEYFILLNDKLLINSLDTYMQKEILQYIFDGDVIRGVIDAKEISTTYLFLIVNPKDVNS